MLGLNLTEGQSDNFEAAVKDRMEDPIRHFEKELVTIRTNRAHPAMVDEVKVSCYDGAVMPIRDLGVVSAPDARLIVIQPWDKSLIPNIEKAIRNSDLGVTPVNDGELIRIQLPEMSGARREELLKLLNRKLEECRVGIRNVRKDFHNVIREAQKKKSISEDFSERLNGLLQKLTDDFIARAEGLADRKTKEIHI